MGGKVLVPIQEQINRLVAARLQVLYMDMCLYSWTARFAT
jgi:isocitrate lyase